MKSINLLKDASEEAVRSYWSNIFHKCFGKQIDRPYNSDGYILDRNNNIKLLIEYKNEEDLSINKNKLAIIAQCLKYYKECKNNNDRRYPTPNIFFCASKKNAFIVDVDKIKSIIDDETVQTLVDSLTGSSLKNDKYII